MIYSYIKCPETQSKNFPFEFLFNVIKICDINVKLKWNFKKCFMLIEESFSTYSEKKIKFQVRILLHIMSTLKINEIK